MRQEPAKPVVLVTGTSSGIGLALARKLYQDSDFRVVVTARRESLNKLRRYELRESDRFLIRPLDINLSEERRSLISEITSIWGGVDILVNNAGIAYRAVLEDMAEQEERAQLQTNYLSPLELIRLVLPSMREKRCGKIINISSVGGMMAMPTMGSYSASKFALEGASEALWYELKPWGIQVVLVQPGFVRSHSFRRVRVSHKARKGLDFSSDYAPYYRNMGAFIGKLMSRAFASPESIADIIMLAVRNKNPPLRLPATIDAHIFQWMRGFLPRRLYHSLLYRNLPNIKEWGLKAGPRSTMNLDAGIPVQIPENL